MVVETTKCRELCRSRRTSVWPVLGLLVMVACSTSATTDRQPNRAEARHGGILRMVTQAPASLDPADVESVYESLPVNQIFDGLVAIDPCLHVTPALAATWSISRDGRTYTFHLRPDVRFHDGMPLDADDVVFTVRRLLEPGRTTRNIAFSYLSVLAGARDYSEGKRPDLPGVRAIDPLTVRIELQRPYLSFLEVLAMDGLRVVPRHVLERAGNAFAQKPVGTGPFKLESWGPAVLRLTANPDYFAGKPYLDRVDIYFLRDDENDAGTERFDRGDVDVVEVPSESLDRLTMDPRARIERYQELSLSFLGISTQSGQLGDVRVRQAIAHAIDRRALVDFAPQIRKYTVGILPPGMPSYSPSMKALAFDPAASRRLLAEAGYPGGRGLRPVKLYNTGRSPAKVQLLDRLRTNLADIGITLEVVDVPWTELSRRTSDHSAPAFLIAWIADLTDPDAFLRSLFESGGSANYFAFSDRASDALLEAGAGEMNPVERARIYRQLEQRILEQAPVVPLYHTVGILALRKGIHGFQPGPLGLASMNLERVWMDGGKVSS